MTTIEANETVIKTVDLVKELLNKIDKDREREIIARRFGLFDRKETLEQIGEMLGITRERVRQLEKTVMIKLKGIISEGTIDSYQSFEAKLIESLQGNGGVLKVSYLTDIMSGNSDKTEQSRISFLAMMSSKITTVPENDNYFNIIALNSLFDEKNILSTINSLVDSVTKKGTPCSLDDLKKLSNNQDGKQLSSLINCSKKVAFLNDHWGLLKWPTVNPKNIRDKIYVILKENGKHMHFNEISEAIKKSDFKRKDVTTQAIHNELIKDKRFILVGRGIYALTEWGYQKGTVSDIIRKILEEANEPLHRDEIIKRVLKNRFVKETTILLNLQGKDKFKRVSKATYVLSNENE